MHFLCQIGASQEHGVFAHHVLIGGAKQEAAAKTCGCQSKQSSKRIAKYIWQQACKFIMSL